MNKLLALFFPNRCDICATVVELNSTRCHNCTNAKRIEGEICDKCGSQKDKCTCKKSHHSPDYKSVVAPYYYEGSIVNAMHNFKFNGYAELSEGMAKEMAAVIKNRYSNIKFDAVTYVPISEKRQKKRGYNQSLLLAEHICKELNLPLEHSLYKVFENPPLRTLNARRRKADVFGAFDIRQGVVPKGKIYLVVDDVKTTGATLSECSAVLDSYGAKEVYAAAFAIR